jgi:hypothetical protein
MLFAPPSFVEVVGLMRRCGQICDAESSDRKFVRWDDSRSRSREPGANVPDEHSKWVLVLRRVFGNENDLPKLKLAVNQGRHQGGM